METYEIYTLGSGYYLEKILNGINLIFDPTNDFVSTMKLACLAAIFVLTVRAGLNNDFKTAAKWFLGVTILIGVFLNSKVDVVIIDKLPDSYGRLSAGRPVNNVPLGLAFLGSATSKIGNSISEKFDEAIAGVFNNSAYQETGILFGSKIVEDASRIQIEDANLRKLMLNFYKRCMVPDIKMGYKRTNGYSLNDLTESDNLLEFLKDHSSKARMIYIDGLGHQTCQRTAEYLHDSLSSAVDNRLPILSKQFSSFFLQGQNNPTDASQVFESVLQGSYGIFIKNNSRTAKEILLQNIAINSLSGAASAEVYGSTATSSMTKLAYNSVGQMAQKFIPILRAVLECLFYGVFPLILILMVTPIGLDVLKNYSFGFIYLQLWQPMYAILFCIASSWGKLYSMNITDITFASHSSIMRINEEISSVAGYMLTLVPILSLFITKGMVANMGNLTSSILYIPQTSAVGNAESAIKGNYQIGTTSIDTHSSNLDNSNKYDDNYSWMSGMKSYSMPSGASEKIFSDGRSSIDMGGAINNLAGLARVDVGKAMGERFDKSITDNLNRAEKFATSKIENASSGFSKMLGYDENLSKNSQVYENWSKTLSSDDRAAIEEARNYVDTIASSRNISKTEALRLALSGNFRNGVLGVKSGASVNSSTSTSKSSGFNKGENTSKDERFAASLSKLENLANSSSFQEGSSSNNAITDNARADFAKSNQASLEMSNSLDKASSLQQSKAKFMQNNAGYSQDLTNQFSDENIAKYGAENFESMLRNNPQKVAELLDEFTNRKLNSASFDQEFTKAKSEYSNDSILSNYQDNSSEIQNLSNQNIEKLENEIPENLKGEIHKSLSRGEKSKAETLTGLSKNNQKIETQKSSIDNKADDLTKKVNKKVSKGAFRHMASELNPLKKKDD